MGAELGKALAWAPVNPVWVHPVLGAGKRGGRCRLAAGDPEQEEGKTEKEAQESCLPGAETTDSCQCGSPGWRGTLGAGKKRLRGSRLRGKSTLPVYVD